MSEQTNQHEKSVQTFLVLNIQLRVLSFVNVVFKYSGMILMDSLQPSEELGHAKVFTDFPLLPPTS